MTLQSSDHVVVVGAGLAGWRFCEYLRLEGFEGPITLIGDEPYAPYDRPPLSKQVLSGKWPVEQVVLATQEKLSAANVTCRFGSRATAVDVSTTSVTLESGERINGSHVVIATGVRARALQWSAKGLWHVRTRDDVEAIRQSLESAPEGAPLIVIGAGFVGAEAATALTDRGFSVHVIEAAPLPLRGVLGDTVAGWLSSLPHSYGVDLQTNRQIVDITGEPGNYTVTLADGSALEAYGVLEAIGSVPDLDWLCDSGLALDRGVVVDEHGQAASHVGALGDIAQGSDGTAEHWQAAIDQAARLAKWWVRGEVHALPHSYFWSDQYGKKIQVLGHPLPSDTFTLVHGSVEEGKWLALASRDGHVCAIVTLSQPRALMLSRVLLDDAHTVEEALESHPWAPNPA